MPLSRSRDYLSIGEVLEAIRADFPDVSISKIRFLENEGLIAPERTESGYRKFYDPDIARLRYILSLQRDHFLPLKVIKQRLAHGDDGDPELPAGSQASEPDGLGGEDPAGDGGKRLTREQLREATGMSEQQVAGLEDFAILDRRGDDHYDLDEVRLAGAAAGLFEFGVEPRHMRMFRQAAEREAALIDQIVAPITRKRDPEARREAAEAARRLVELTRQMHDALLRSSLRDHL